MAPSGAYRLINIPKSSAFLLVLVLCLLGVLQQSPVLNAVKLKTKEHHRTEVNISDKIAEKASPSLNEEKLHVIEHNLTRNYVRSQTGALPSGSKLNEGEESQPTNSMQSPDIETGNQDVTQNNASRSEEGDSPSGSKWSEENPQPSEITQSADIKEGGGDRPRSCAPREGVIVSNMMGRMANNLFEVGFANRMSEALCWSMWCRRLWQGTLDMRNERGKLCFPNAGMDCPQALSPDLQVKLPDLVTPKSWNETSLLVRPTANPPPGKMMKNLTQAGIAYELPVPKFQKLVAEGKQLDFLQELRSETSKVLALELKSFFMDMGWFVGWEDRLRHVLHTNEACCLAQPPPDAVVIHIQDFLSNTRSEWLDAGIQAPACLKIIDHCNLRDRPMWIACQPKTVEAAMVKEIVEAFPDKNIAICTGIDPCDAFCTLAWAKTSLLSAHSSFSQMAGILVSKDADVHLPADKTKKPKVTVNMMRWKHHLANATDVLDFDIDNDKFEFVVS